MWNQQIWRAKHTTPFYVRSLNICAFCYLREVEWGPGTSPLPPNSPASLQRYWGMTVILKCSHRGRVHKKQAQSENHDLQSCGNCSFSFDPLCDFGCSQQVWLHFAGSQWLSIFPLCVPLQIQPMKCCICVSFFWVALTFGSLNLVLGHH